MSSRSDATAVSRPGCGRTTWSLCSDDGLMEATSNLGRATAWPNTPIAVMTRSMVAATIPGPERVRDTGRDWPSNLAMRCPSEPPFAAMTVDKWAGRADSNSASARA